MNYDQIRSMLSSEDETKLFRKDSDHNVDHLIVKPNVICYVNRSQAGIVEKFGMDTPSKLLEKYPQSKDKIQSIYSDYLQDPILKHCIFAYLCRVPDNLESTRNFIKSNCPIKINIDRFQKKLGSVPVKIYLLNHPDSNKKMVSIDKEKLYKYCQQEASYYEFFKNSRDALLRDVPKVAIYVEDGNLPSFTLKVLKDANKEICEHNILY